MHEWSLNILYKGYEDTCFQSDMKALEKNVDAFNELAKHIHEKTKLEACKEIVKLQEQNKLVLSKLYAYGNLKQATDTTDSKTIAYLEQITRLVTQSSKANSIFESFIAQVKNLDTYIKEDEFLKEYAFYLKEIQENGKYLLSDDVEEVITKLNMSGGSGWESLQSYLTSTLKVEYQGETITLPQIRNLAYDADKQVRKSAYEAELKSYDKIKDAIAFSLNNIKSQFQTVCDLRGFESPLDMTLYQARMKKETLDAMLEAMEEYMPLFQTYLKRKAKLLGYEHGLPWYELFAPLATTSTTYSIDEAKEYLVTHFKPFAQDMADMIQTAFDEQWIDFYPKNGKVGGAFCYNLPFVKQSRVLTNYDGGLGDIVTLAHELGHAYHGMMIQDHHLLNTTYSMPVAETASIFNENIIMNAIIKDAKGEEKIALLENQLQELTQIMCDIYSRFLFEKEVFERRTKGFMFPDELEQIILDAQKKAYGDGVDPAYLHPYMWVCKSHYYSSDLSFYNFPYAFGGLFARGLVLKYQEEGPSFIDTYRKMLKATTVSSVEDVARIAHIDLTDKGFWIDCLKTCEESVQEFLELTK
ncbi:M3 family oligoendopeptidase [Amedibacillus sp. YH-ame10]